MTGNSRYKSRMIKSGRHAAKSKTHLTSAFVRLGLFFCVCVLQALTSLFSLSVRIGTGSSLLVLHLPSPLMAPLLHPNSDSGSCTVGRGWRGKWRSIKPSERMDWCARVNRVSTLENRHLPLSSLHRTWCRVMLFKGCVTGDERTTHSSVEFSLMFTVYIP